MRTHGIIRQDVNKALSQQTQKWPRKTNQNQIVFTPVRTEYCSLHNGKDSI